jgi:CheY-like chemotaxis protein
MGGDARLNLLLTPLPAPPARDGEQPWHKTLSHLLMPLGVRTFEATSGPQAVELIEKHPIHLAVVDTRLPTLSGLHVLQLIQKLREQPAAPVDPSPDSRAGGEAEEEFHLRMEVEEHHLPSGTQRRIEVRFDARPARQVQRPGPAVILIAPPPPQQDPQLLQEALKFNAFSVLSEPVDVNLALEVLARALKRFHQNQWPV